VNVIAEILDHIRILKGCDILFIYGETAALWFPNRRALLREP